MTRSVYAKGGKRVLDLTVGVLLVVLSSPLQVASGVIVLATAGRPMLFSQQRAGLDGAPFRLFKFRTMIEGAHELSGGYPTASMVTPVGRFMRKSSLDELPQVWNLLRGDVSLVGPRPALLDQVERYSERQRMRLAVRPGITGLAQVRYRNTAPWSRRIEADIEYLQRITFLGDAKILLRTIPAVLFGVGVAVGQTAADVDDLGRETQP